jgi:hypothetical protein
VKLFSIALLLASAIYAEEAPTSKRVWIRRITLGAACAANLGFDTITTHRAVSAGAAESNGLLSNSQGKPVWGRVIGIKAGTCAVSAFFQERSKTRQSDWTFTGVNAGVTAAYTAVGIHNLHVTNDLFK